MKTDTIPVPASAIAGNPQPARVRAHRLNPGKIAAIAVLAVVAVVAGSYGLRHLQFALSHEDTDDAQVEGDISPVLPRVSGYITRILVVDNQHVEAGQPLVEIDSRELDLKIAETEAGVESAEASSRNAWASLANAQAAAEVARANTAVAAVTQAKTAADFKRDNRLFQTGAITDRDETDSSLNS